MKGKELLDLYFSCEGEGSVGSCVSAAQKANFLSGSSHMEQVQ